MCLVVFAWKSHPNYKLVLAANRDEYYRRPTESLGWWADHPNVLAGRDLQAGGTWLAVSRSGLFATITNYREQIATSTQALSRGQIVSKFVVGDADPHNFVQTIDGNRYAGFSLLAASGEEMYYMSNRGDSAQSLLPGIYGLSNASLDTPWTKLRRAREKLADLVRTDQSNQNALIQMMSDRLTADTDETDSGTHPIELERALTATFIVTPSYGTRCTTALLIDYAGNVSMTEQRFDSGGLATGLSQFSFAIDPIDQRSRI